MTRPVTAYPVLMGCFTAALAVAAPPPEPEDAFLLSFVVGDYALVGQGPDSSLAYAGVARIEKTPKGLTLTRQLGARTVRAEGRIGVPNPPGEGRVIRFRWVDREPRVMTCLVSADLDNEARLTCTVVVEGQPHIQPGIEALFSMATWPKPAPHRARRLYPASGAAP